jgi:hypothetical protein
MVAPQQGWFHRGGRQAERLDPAGADQQQAMPMRSQSQKLERFAGMARFAPLLNRRGTSRVRGAAARARNGPE